MDTRERQTTEPAGPSRRTWLPIAGGAVAIAALLAGLVFLGGGEDAARQEQALDLNAGGEDATASCIAFTPQELANVAEIAFEGTVISVDGPEVRLSVDQWYKGSGQGEVVLNAPLGMEALIGGIPFVEGNQYLISAQGGNVNYCGFSGPSSPEYRSSFEEAFAA